MGTGKNQSGVTGSCTIQVVGRRRSCDHHPKPLDTWVSMFPFVSATEIYQAAGGAQSCPLGPPVRAGWHLHAQAADITLPHAAGNRTTPGCGAGCFGVRAVAGARAIPAPHAANHRGWTLLRLREERRGMLAKGSPCLCGCLNG